MPAFLGPLMTGLGILAGRKEGREYRSREAQRFQAELAAQKEFAQHGIRWRVEDAKAAGLHPLYALGANLPSYSPTFSSGVGGGSSVASDMASLGQSISGAIQTKEAREAQQLSLELLRSQIGETDARRDYYSSEAARARQAAGVTPNFPRSEQFQDVPGTVGRVQVDPASVISRSHTDDSMTAGVNPAWSRFRLAPDLEVVLPSVEGGGMSESAEALSESLLLMALTVQENRRRYGPEQADKFMRRYLGGDEIDRVKAILNMLPFIGE